MARTVNQQEYAEKRQEILAAAQQLVYTKGYQRMTIQDILAMVKISNGAFYHYFDSKAAVLEALVEQMQHGFEQPLLAILDDPHISALAKLQQFFAGLNRSRMDNQALVLNMLRSWYTDDNAIVRQKVDQALIKRRAPLLNSIVHQGVQEGIFTIITPEHAGDILLALLHGMGNTHAGLLLGLTHGQDEQRCADAIVASHAAYMEAIERVLGAPAGSFERTNAAAVRVWLCAKEEAHEKETIQQHR